jgi:arylsulfatase A-like enzyme
MFDPTGEYDEGRASVARGFSTDVFGNAAVEFLESPKDQRPYFLYVAFTAPHDPRTPVLPYSSMYRPDQLTLPPNVMQRHPFDNGALSGRDERLAPTVRSREIVAQHLADYYGMISHLDKAVGDIVSASRRSARGRDTVIIYTADHGLALGNHGLMGKQNLYDHSLRIPLIITGVGHSGSVESSLWYNSDVYRTIGTIGGVPGLDDCPSQDMLSGLQGREYVFGAYKDLQRSAIGHAWKLIRYYKSETSGVGTERAQLFDLGTDPFELNDRSSDPGCSGTLEELKSELEMWQVQHNDPLANIRSDA